MIKKSNIVVEDLKLRDLKKFQNFVKKFYGNKTLIKKKFYKSTILNQKMLNYLFWNNYTRSYNFKIVKKNDIIIGIHGYIPQSHFDSKLNKNEIFLGLVIAKKKIKFPLIPLTFYSIMNNNKFQFLGTINPSLLPILKIKKFKIYKMAHSFIKNKKNKKMKNLKISKYEFLDQQKLKYLKTKKIYEGLIPKKSDNFLINRYLKHPQYKYSLVANLDLKNNLKNILIFRVIKNNKINLLRIVDYVGKERDLVYCNALLNNLINKVDFIDFYSHGISDKILQKTGFENIEDYKNLTIPNYFEPFVNKNIELMCAYKIKSKTNVMLFKGDGDQDHPRKKMP